MTDETNPASGETNPPADGPGTFVVRCGDHTMDIRAGSAAEAEANYRRWAGVSAGTPLAVTRKE